jgi:hypothetical protein
MQKLLSLLVLSMGVMFFFACGKSDSTTNRLAFVYDFNASQERLNNIGQIAPIAPGHAAQTPDFKKMSVHYIELAPSAFTLLGQGEVVYKGVETTKGGELAVDFDQAPNLAAGQKFAEIELSSLKPGTYEWVRVSVTYQNYDIAFDLMDGATSYPNQKGSVSSFVGFNTYISSITPFEQPLEVLANKKQGFWAFETKFAGALAPLNRVISGQGPAGATTVVNPLFASSPVPPGSCVVTGKFAQPLVITGNETEHLRVKLSFSVNQSFEWKDTNGDGKWTVSSTQTEQVVDMGLRGLIPSWTFE